jgi:hypothetical protein
MEKNTVLGLLIIAAFFFSCKKEEVKIIIKPIVIEERSEVLSLSELVDTLIVVPLETASQALVGEISKIQTNEDYLFVLDKGFSESVFIYDWNGKLKLQLTGTGEGPGEFEVASNFYLSWDRQTIYILDSSLGKILQFDLSGNFISEKKLGVKNLFYDLIPLPSGFVSLKSDQQTMSLFLDYLDVDFESTGKIVEFDQKNGGVFGGIKPRYFYQTISGEYWYKESLGSTLYQVKDKDDLIPFEYQFLSNQWSPSGKKIWPRDAYRILRNENLQAVGDEIVDFEKYTLINYWQGDNLKFFVVDKQKEKAFKASGIQNDLDGLMDKFPGVFQSNTNPNQIIIDLNPNDLISLLKSRNLNPDYEPIFRNLDLDSMGNPVLLIYQVK